MTWNICKPEKKEKELEEATKNTKYEVEILGRDSAGRSTANTLKERLAMKKINSNPQRIVLTRIPMTDSCWPKEGG